VFERAVVMSGAEVLTPDAIALEPLTMPEPPQSHEESAETGAAAGPDGTLQETLDRAATAKIRQALEAAKGNRAVAASALGVDRTTLYRLMKRLGLSES
jgi:DNA-binding NtrC family response regulator